MKIIDEKGKLFGLINIIDLSVVLVILLVIGAIGFKSFQAEPVNVETKDVLVTVKCTYLKTDAIPKAFNKGDRLVASNNYVPNAFIEEVEYYTSDYGAETDDGRVVSAKHPLLTDAIVTIKAKINVSGPIMKIGPQEIRIGSTYLVKTSNAEAYGIVESITVLQ